MKTYNVISKINVLDIGSDLVTIIPVGQNLYEVDYDQNFCSLLTADESGNVFNLFVPENGYRPDALLKILIEDYGLELIELSQFIDNLQNDYSDSRITETLMNLAGNSRDYSLSALEVLRDEHNSNNQTQSHRYYKGAQYSRRTPKVYSVINQVKLETILLDNSILIDEMGDLLFRISITEYEQNLLVFNKNYGLSNIIIFSSQEEEHALLDYLIHKHAITVMEYKDIIQHMSICHQLAKPETALFQIGRIAHGKTNKLTERIKKFNTSNINNNQADEIDDLPF